MHVERARRWSIGFDFEVVRLRFVVSKVRHSGNPNLVLSSRIRGVVETVRGDGKRSRIAGLSDNAGKRVTRHKLAGAIHNNGRLVCGTDAGAKERAVRL